MTGKKPPIVVGLGEVLWDCFGDERRLGGAPANQAFHANQLGATGIVASRVGQDVLGDEAIGVLERHGLETTCIQRDGDLPTGTVTVDLGPQGEPAYDIHAPAAWDRMVLTDRLTSVLDQAAAVCFGSLALRDETSRQTILQALQHASTATKLFDVNLRQKFYSAELIRNLLTHSTMVKLNESEASVLPELLDTGTGSHAELAAWLRREYDVSFLCITRSERGCVLFDGDEFVEVQSVPVEVVDAVGAGDAFTAALLCARLEGWPLERSGRLANEIGALVAGCKGAMAPLRNQIAEIRARLA